MMYFPQRYPSNIIHQLSSIETIRYVSSGQPQQAFFVSESSKPKYLWILLGGNAAVALQWLPLLAGANIPDTGYLLVDYPGYGMNSGYPSQKNNCQGVLDAFSALKKQLDLSPNVSILGHSIGAAVAIDVSLSLYPKSLVLVSPFTSMYAMSKRVIGSIWAWLISPFLWDPYRSEVTLKTLITTYPDTQILILHGQSDNVVPYAMGQKLASISPSIEFQALVGVGHDLPYAARDHFLAALRHK
tara:strand:- start:613 stop:1341 length:729 start_codon:yes stop_codon:yes gene_type:complete